MGPDQLLQYARRCEQERLEREEERKRLEAQWERERQEHIAEKERERQRREEDLRIRDQELRAQMELFAKMVTRAGAKKREAEKQIQRQKEEESEVRPTPIASELAEEVQREEDTVDDNTLRKELQGIRYGRST